jgi:hypothetical protein
MNEHMIVGTKIVDLVETPGLVGMITEQGTHNPKLIKVEWEDGTISIEDLEDEESLWIFEADYKSDDHLKINDQGNAR